MHTIVLIAEGTATLLATIFFFKYKNTQFKFLLPYLWVMLLMENAHHLFTISDLMQFVRWNLFGTLGALLFMWMFRSEIQSKSRRKIISIFMVSVVVMYIAHIGVLGFSDLYTVGTFSEELLTIITIAIYAAGLFSRTQVYRLSKDPVVWIGISFVILSANFPVIQTAKLFYYGKEVLFTNILWIMTGIIVLMYSVLSFGFIWSEKRS